MQELTSRFSPPIRHFFGARSVAPADVNEGDIAFVGMPSDATHSSRIGARFGPRALRHETTRLLAQLKRDAAGGGLYDTRCDRFVELAELSRLVDLGDAEINENDVEATIESIANLTSAAAIRGALPVAIGGDHFNGYPACLGVSRALAVTAPSEKFGYIHIDGHLDFGDRLGAWGKYNHATNARRIAELPNISRSNMVWIGIAGWVDGADVAEIEAAGGLIISAEEWNRRGTTDVAQRALAHALKGRSRAYLTIDIDALDAGFLPGTGSVVHSEITPRHYLDLLGEISEAPLCGIDLVEVAPPLDPSGRSEKIAARLLFEVLKPRLVKVVGA